MAIKKRILIVLIAAILLLGAVDIFGIFLLRRHGMFVRLAHVEDLSQARTTFNIEDLQVLEKIFQGDDPQRLLEQVMNEVSQAEDFAASDVNAIYDHVQQGGGLICTGMATFYSTALQANHIEARRVVLKRDQFDIYDTHTTVEVLVDGRWVIFDPTFNVSFTKNGRLIGAQAVTAALFDGTFNEIEPVFYGDVSYPVRLGDYYMHWLLLFNNVFVADVPNRDVIAKLPPFRYWWGPVYYFEESTFQQGFHYQFQNQLYFWLVVVVPAMISAAVFAVFILLVLQFRDNRNFTRQKNIL